MKKKAVKCGKCKGRGEYAIGAALFNCRWCGGTGKLTKPISSPHSYGK